MRNPFKKRTSPLGGRGDVFRSVRRRERKHMRHRWQWVLLAIVVVLGAIAGYTTWLYYDTQGSVQGEVLDVEPPEEDKPFNVLLVGSDSREGLTEEEQAKLGAAPVDGQRADTLILARIDPETGHVTMIQFPRDLYVEIPDEGKNRINAALAVEDPVEGRTRTVRTVEALTGLSINRYVQVDIAGFHDLVDAIGGVDICVPKAIPFDPTTGLEIEEPGMVHFNGDNATRFVRSRKAFGTDFDRIANQQKFLSAALDKVTSFETFLHITRIGKLLDVAGDHVTIDKGTSLKDLYEIGQVLRDFNPEDYEAYSIPNRGLGEAPVGSIVVPDYRTIEVMFDAIQAGESPAEADTVPNIDPSTISIGVYNGTFTEGAAEDAAGEIERATTTGTGSVEVVDIANANNSKFKRTVIRYSDRGPEAARMAELLAEVIPGAAVEEGKTESDVDVAIIVGKRFETKRLVQILPIPLPRSDSVPEVCREG